MNESIGYDYDDKYLEGHVAALAGQCANTCPYRPESANADAWMDGYRSVYEGQKAA